MAKDRVCRGDAHGGISGLSVADMRQYLEFVADQRLGVSGRGGGRSDFMKRFGSGFGTTNLHGHTTVCQGSLYFTCKAISEQYQAGKFTGGQKFYWQTDLEKARYVLFVGANLLEANYGPTNRAVRLMENMSHGTLKIGVVDPRFSKLASKAKTWLPIKPGEDAALAMAIIRWMIENNRFDAKFLRGANKAAAKANGETTWTNSSWLVEVKDGKPVKFVRAADVGVAGMQKRSIPDPKDKEKTIEYEEKFFFVVKDGKPVAFGKNAMWTDPSLRNNTCLLDPVGGSVSFYDTMVSLVKV